MTKVVFENATIRDVIGKAGRVAPTRGSAFDKAAGIVIDVDVPSQQVIVRATDLYIFYMEVADFTSMEGESVRWRIPSSVIDGICSKLPIQSGKTVSFDDSQGPIINIVSGRMRANIRTISPEYYPQWDAFDASDLETVGNFGAAIQMVQWAALKNGDPPMTGIHLDGEHVIATDRVKIALAPCKATPLYKPITIPSGIFTPLMKTLGDVRLGMDENELFVQPDEAVQIRAVIFAAEYPPIKKVLTRQEPDHVTFKKGALIEIIERATVMAARERTQVLKMYVGQEEIAVMMNDEEIGFLGDVIEVPGFAKHTRVQINFTPDNLTGAINGSPNDDVTMWYNQAYVEKPVRIDGGSGYEALVMPRRQNETNG